MATESVAADVGPAITEHWLESAWEKSGLPMGTRNRLKKVDRCVQTMTQIHRRLMADHLGKMDARDSGADHAGLPEIDLDTLMVAMLELGDRAADMLEEVRENERGFNQSGV